MEVELVCRETIKPSSPTPPHLKVYTLSFIDAIVFRNYVPVVYFYYPDQVCDQASKVSRLKKSLSQVLSKYYPLAGRFRDQLSIDCNDQGVSLLVTRIKASLPHNLHNPAELQLSLSPLFPHELPWNKQSSSASLLVIQINCFECGGMAISVCLSHKAGDAATLFNLVNDWATLNQKHGEDEGKLPSPPVLTTGPSVFPQGELPLFPEAVFRTDKVVCRRLVVEGCKIESLKAMVSSENVENPTRVQVVTAWIYKRAVSALGSSFESKWFRVAVNLRKRMVPPLPEKSVGNIAWWFFVMDDGKETQVHELVSKMKQGLLEFCETYGKKLGGKEKDSLFISECLKQSTSSAAEDDPMGFIFSSWCGFHMYEADFGWGKPIWVTTTGCPVRNGVVLMDTRDGKGIEALVSMDHQDMPTFERDIHLLQYASVNPALEHVTPLHLNQ